MSEKPEIYRTNKRRILRTLRCKNRNIIGTLANLISAISAAGTDIGIIKTVAMGEIHNIRDISIIANDEDHLKTVLEKVRTVPNVQLIQVIDEVLDRHQGGKLRTQATYPVESQEDLQKVYTPGVAQVSVMIKQNETEANNYTSIPKNVALVTNGSRVLGLGNMGPVASMPVMEGKAALFSQFTGLNMYPILLSTRDPKKFVETVVEIASGFSAIQIEDVEAPACFEIEEELIRRLEKPVMHDDQHGTAVVALAAAINACHLVGRDIKTLTIGQLGLGAAGQASARLISHYVGHPILGSDPVAPAVERFKKSGGQVLSMENLFKECDLVICTTGRRGLIKKEMIQHGQIILALSNPYPEVTIEDALAAGAAFASDGTRVNNLLGYPGIFKGSLEVQARQINIAMLVAAAEAIAHASPDRELVPSALDPELHRQVAKAVALAAVKTGVARYIPEQYA
jgi:malate dehydrogenase (oxaloacetate-decarboxylating)